MIAIPLVGTYGGGSGRGISQRSTRNRLPGKSPWPWQSSHGWPTSVPADGQWWYPPVAKSKSPLAELTTGQASPPAAMLELCKDQSYRGEGTQCEVSEGAHGDCQCLRIGGQLPRGRRAV